MKQQVAAYVSPMAARARRQGVEEELIARLLAARRKLASGRVTLLELVADGTISGWRLRTALSNCLGEAVANWDTRAGRTQLERQALVERALSELGVSPMRLGGVS